MALLRLNRRPNQKGIGPNRDDAPMFERYMALAVANKQIPREMRFAAQHRVQKYERQVIESPYAEAVMRGDIKGLVDVFDQVRKHHEQEAVQREESYGGW
jgi:hypothetical protein